MPVPLTLYTRSGCHLCEDMEQALAELAVEFNFVTEQLTIDNDDELEQAYGSRVPVLFLKQVLVCEYFLDRVALTEALARYRNEEHS